MMASENINSWGRKFNPIHVSLCCEIGSARGRCSNTSVFLLNVVDHQTRLIAIIHCPDSEPSPIPYDSVRRDYCFVLGIFRRPPNLTYISCTLTLGTVGSPVKSRTGPFGASPYFAHDKGMGFAWAWASPYWPRSNPVARPINPSQIPVWAKHGQTGPAWSNPVWAPYGLAIWVISCIVVL